MLCNPAFDSIAGGQNAMGRSFADLVEQLVGRELAPEISETVRSGQASSIPVELGNREYLLVLEPMSPGNEKSARYYAAYWRGGTVRASLRYWAWWAVLRRRFCSRPAATIRSGCSRTF